LRQTAINDFIVLKCARPARKSLQETYGLDESVLVDEKRLLILTGTPSANYCRSYAHRMALEERRNQNDFAPDTSASFFTI